MSSINCIKKLSTFAICGAVAVTAALAEADTFVWHGPNDAVGSGTFGTAGNWFDSTGNRTQAVPGAADDITVGNGGVSVVADENDYAVDPVRLVIDANAFGRKHPNGTATLIECATASAESLQRLANNLEFVNTRDVRKGTVAVVDGKKLVYTAPPAQGMVATIR